MKLNPDTHEIKTDATSGLQNNKFSLQVAKVPVEKPSKCKVYDEWCQLRHQNVGRSQPETFMVDELGKAFNSIKPCMAAGYDNILLEFLKHLGLKAAQWLTNFYIWIINEKTLPWTWPQVKIIVILKPGKDPYKVSSYCLVVRVFQSVWAFDPPVNCSRFRWCLAGWADRVQERTQHLWWSPGLYHHYQKWFPTKSKNENHLLGFDHHLWHSLA